MQNTKRPDKAKFRNPDGSYNGVAYIAALSGLSEAEITWSWARAKELRDAGKSTEELKAILKSEAAAKFGKPQR